MQQTYISKLLELAEADPNVFHILADSGTNLDEHFKRNYPDRMLNFGIAEQNTIGIAAGLATGGKIPFVFIQGAFIVYRAMEFVRNDICFQNLNVKLVGQGSGIAWAGLGPSHHTTEDIAILRALPNLTIFSPATPYQVGACTSLMHGIVGPCYMRIGMNNEREFFNEQYVIPETGQDVMNEEGDIAIFTTGAILEEVMEAVEMLADIGIRAIVVNVVKIKPFDERNILRYSNIVKKIIVVEEHQVYGGLGSIIADVLATHGCDIQLVKIGLQDAFAKGYLTSQKQLRKENGLDACNIKKRIEHELLQ